MAKKMTAEDAEIAFTLFVGRLKAAITEEAKRLAKQQGRRLPKHEDYRQALASRPWIEEVAQELYFRDGTHEPE